ncbi:MAG TPA: GYF domain-containing protein, partial [Polyangiaceae bacterium]|nr:GYF domain-containing protein [Polyangiaceae bacterium]
MSFPITCTACHKTFTISDEIYEKKVAGRVVTIKCKSCSAGIRVDGTKGGGAAAAPAPAAAAPAPAEAAPVGEPLWAVDYPDGQDREFTTAEVVIELERGTINGTTLVWRDGMAEWLEVHQVPELGPGLAQIEAKKKAAAAAAAAKAAAAAAAK